MTHNNISGSSGKPYSFTIKDSSTNFPSTIATSEYNIYGYGEVITGSIYPLASTISSDYFETGHDSVRLRALKNTLNYNARFSKHYSYESIYGNKSNQSLRLIGIPSIFYGSSIRKGSISCKWYLTGTLIAELADTKQNGELIQIGPFGSIGSGSVAGVALYNEGFIILTGSWNLHSSYTDNFNVNSPTSLYPPSWKYFMTSGSYITVGTSSLLQCGVPSSSFAFDFDGVNYIETLTMMARADKGEFNHSNNKTYIKYGQNTNLAVTSSTQYIEKNDIEIKNITHSDFIDEQPVFEKTTYISKIGIYDEEKNLIAIAKLATPVRKKINDNYLFKIKLDI